MSISSELKAALIFGGIVVAGVAYVVTENKRNDYKKAIKLAEAKQAELDKAEKEAEFPPEYWAAKEAKTRADAEIRKAEIESKEHLEMDKRNREDVEKAAIREFEKDAPDSYWEHKRYKESEKTKRVQINADEARARRLADAERDIARRNAQALEVGAKSLERAIRNNITPGSFMSV